MSKNQESLIGCPNHSGQYMCSCDRLLPNDIKVFRDRSTNQVIGISDFHKQLKSVMEEKSSDIAAALKPIVIQGIEKSLIINKETINANITIKYNRPWALDNEK